MVKLRQPWMVKSLAWMAAKTLKAVVRTCRYEVHTETPATDPSDPLCTQRYIYAVWHDALMAPVTIRTFRRTMSPLNRISALVSMHHDGTQLTEFMRHFRIDAIRGSSSKGGAQALRQLRDVTKTDHICITPDGPRGPRRKVQQGLVYLASATGLPILANSSAMSRAWDFQGSWTNLLVPKPFSRVVCVVSRPLFVPPRLKADQLLAYQELVEAELNRVEGLAQRLVSREIDRLPEIAPHAALGAPASPFTDSSGPSSAAA